jgi:hypothetical protein
MLNSDKFSHDLTHTRGDLAAPSLSNGLESQALTVEAGALEQELCDARFGRNQCSSHDGIQLLSVSGEMVRAASPRINQSVFGYELEHFAVDNAVPPWHRLGYFPIDRDSLAMFHLKSIVALVLFRLDRVM